MTFTEMALRMYPYWILGLFMMYATYCSKYRNLLRIEWPKLTKFMFFLGFITIYRVIVFKVFAGHDFIRDATSGVTTIPLMATLTVFWEDCAHALPLAIFSLFLGMDSLWKKILTYLVITMVAVSFGLGHVYQGYFAAFLLSFYIPYTFKKGQEVGFGTVMIAHVLYDFITLLTVKNLLGY